MTPTKRIFDKKKRRCRWPRRLLGRGGAAPRCLVWGRVVGGCRKLCGRGQLRYLRWQGRGWPDDVCSCVGPCGGPLVGFLVRCLMNRSVPVPCTFRAHMPDPISAVTCCYPGTSCCSGCRPIDLSSGRATGASQWILYIRGKGGSVWGSGLVATCRAAMSLATCSEPCREQASRGHPC